MRKTHGLSWGGCALHARVRQHPGVETGGRWRIVAGVFDVPEAGGGAKEPEALIAA